MHVIVNRRGLDHGRLLSTYKGSLLNVDELRRIQADTAEEHGIALTATPRLARGITDIALGTSAYRDALRAGGEPGLRSMPQSLEAQDFETLRQARAHLLGKLSEADENIRRTCDSAERVRLERDIGPLKGKVSVYASDRADLTVYAMPVPKDAELYRSEALERARAHGIELGAGTHTDRAGSEIRKAARDLGIDGDAFVACYTRGGPQEAGTAAAWSAQDMVAIMKHRGIDPEKADRADIRDAATFLDKIHEQTLGRFREATDRDQVPALYPNAYDGQMEHAVRRISNEAKAGTAAQHLRQLGIEARAAIDNSKDRPATITEIDAERAFVNAIDRQIDDDGRRALQRGSSQPLVQITDLDATSTERAELALTYLEAGRDLSDEQTCGRHAEAIMTARSNLTAARANERTAERGRDRDDG